MIVEQVAENILYVVLPKTLHINRELQPVNEKVTIGYNCDVILDFALVDIMTSSSISALLGLRNLLNTHNHQLILCNVSFLTKCEFTTTGLAHYFRFVKDKNAALKSLHYEGATA